MKFYTHVSLSHSLEEGLLEHNAAGCILIPELHEIVFKYDSWYKNMSQGNIKENCSLRLKKPLC